MNVESPFLSTKKNPHNITWRRVRYAGQILLAGLALARCGSQPINMDAYNTVVAKEVQPTAVPRRGLFDSTVTPAEKNPVATSTPEINSNHMILFGLLELDNRQRLAIKPTEADVEFEIASSPNTVPPVFRNPFEGATISQIYDVNTDIGAKYGTSICLLLKDNQTTVCFNNVPVITAEVRKAFENKTALKSNTVIGTIGSAVKLPDYPQLLPDKAESTFRGLVSVSRSGSKIPLSNVLPAFTGRDTRNDPK